MAAAAKVLMRKSMSRLAQQLHTKRSLLATRPGVYARPRPFTLWCSMGSRGDLTSTARAQAPSESFIIFSSPAVAAQVAPAKQEKPPKARGLPARRRVKVGLNARFLKADRQIQTPRQRPPTGDARCPSGRACHGISCSSSMQWHTLQAGSWHIANQLQSQDVKSMAYRRSRGRGGICCDERASRQQLSQFYHWTELTNYLHCAGGLGAAAGVAAAEGHPGGWQPH